MDALQAVILAGGKGTRFWPFSSTAKPKQFLDITGDGSMLRLTFERLVRFVSSERMLVFTVAGMEDSISRELPEIPSSNVFSEPVGRNTAPSLAVAAALGSRGGSDTPMLCCPADHVIGDEEEFERLALAAADLAARRDVLITFGIEPVYPATGYGYIEAGESVAELGGRSFYRVGNFHEKPESTQAKAYLERGSFYWNSGIFVWRPSVFLAAWERHVPDGVGPLREIAESFGTAGEKATIEEMYPRMPSISVDYAILEKADNVLVAPADISWNDVGSWDALFELLPASKSGNIEAGRVVQIDSRGNLLFNPEGVTAAIGIEGLIVVVKDGTVLVCKKGESQRVRDLIEKLEGDGDHDLL